jgi:predicted O-methyltransferase YrrM
MIEALSVEARISQVFAGVRDVYATHRPVLLAAVLRIPDGPILELGAGDGSTVALHEVAQATGRLVITCESDRTWFERFAQLGVGSHAVVHVDSWELLDNVIFQAIPFGVAFIDHAPVERRIIDAEWLAKRARVVVAHDTNSEDYYKRIRGLFKHHATYARQLPWTSVLSNFVDVSGWTFDE